MENADRDVEPVPELDALIHEFVASGFAPDGAYIDDDRPSPHHGHGHGSDGVRRFTYRGHAVQVVTHYAVTIDGEPWAGHLAVQDDGTVTYHGLPQYVVPSAVDLLRRVIDASYEAPQAVRDAIRAAGEED
jgi:hypothetical protein